MRSRFVYAGLAVTWLLIAVWQGSEHLRMREASRRAVLERAHDMADTVGIVVRSVGMFGIVPQDVLNLALDEMTDTGDLLYVGVLNAEGEVAAASGQPPDIPISQLLHAPDHWEKDSLTSVNVVALGEDAESSSGSAAKPIVIPREQDDKHKDRSDDGTHRPRKISSWDDQEIDLLAGILTGEPLTDDMVSLLLAILPPGLLEGDVADALSDKLKGRPLDRKQLQDSLALIKRHEREPKDDRSFKGHRFGRPHWMSEAEYEQLMEKRGAHWFVITLSTSVVHEFLTRDLALRAIIVVVALAAAGALALAWNGQVNYMRLQVRLARINEMNMQLREMNLAAAGLAHETKNPLNIVRGLAQLIGRNPKLPEDVTETANDITEEVDRVTERLNRFLDYSKPVDAAIGPVSLTKIVTDVARVLETDREDKGVEFALDGADMTVLADAALLRQIVFNLLLNALQAAPRDGHILVTVKPSGKDTVRLEVEDDGPGVPDDVRDEIFRPYFTTSEEGTGLGLAVVRQLIHAHQWDVECVRAVSGGACFRVSGIRTTNEGTNPQ